MARVTVRLYGDLAELAGEADRHGVVETTFPGSRSVKDLVESLGVPHTEVDLLLIDGESVSFDAPIDGGERVSVYPRFHELTPEAVSRVRVEPPAEMRFTLDVHLGRLAELLRLLGLDARYDNDADDEGLAEEAGRGQRILLTRDRGLLMRSVVVHGYLVRSHDPLEQAVEVVRRFELADVLRPFSRCLRCNGLLADVDKAEVVDELPPRTRRDHHRFRRCRACGNVYWRGSHHERLRDLVDAIRERVAS